MPPRFFAGPLWFPLKLFYQPSTQHTPTHQHTDLWRMPDRGTRRPGGCQLSLAQCAAPPCTMCAPAGGTRAPTDSARLVQLWTGCLWWALDAPARPTHKSSQGFCCVPRAGFMLKMQHASQQIFLRLAQTDRQHATSD